MEKYKVNPLKHVGPNLITMTDSYKVTHWKQYPPGTSHVYSYFESRGGDYPEVCFFGLQYFLSKYLEGQVITRPMIDEAEELFRLHLGTDELFNREGWEYILDHHGGRLPVRIRAVPEGTVVPTGNVLMTIENTDPKCWWLTNYLETLLVQVWYPTTVATLSREMKKMMLGYLEDNGDPSGIDFKLHDFGFRGVSSVESAGLGGAAHLVNFKGTDTMRALEVARGYYGALMAGHSIPASEHSTITAWGRENEVDAFRNMLDQYPVGPVACVSDSYNIYDACERLWGEELLPKLINRKDPLVIRPDSGYPPQVVMDVLEILDKKVGHTVNEKGFKVLPPFVRVIQGDGVDYHMVDVILDRMHEAGWSADNIAFGMGGGLLQKLNRDTLKFAFKCSNVRVNGRNRPVYKDPVTDKGKSSKQGRLKLVKVSDTYTTRAEGGHGKDELSTVFEDGIITYEQNWDAIKKRAACGL